jgi:hypothetical protein
MIDLALDATDNLTLDGNQELALVSDGSEVAQACKIALRAWQREYFLDQAFGVNYPDKIYDKRRRSADREREIRRVLKEVEGVLAIKSIGVGNPDFSTRTMAASIEIITTYGSEVITA